MDRIVLQQSEIISKVPMCLVFFEEIGLVFRMLKIQINSKWSFASLAYKFSIFRRGSFMVFY